MSIKIRKELVTLWDGKENLKIIHISDLHLKWDSQVLEETGKIIGDYDPELIVMTGDYYDTKKGIKMLEKFLKKISDKYICLVIYGNHDLRYNKDILENIVKSTKAIWLHDGPYYYQSKKGYRYNFYSISHILEGEKNTSNEDTKDILLVHNPDKLKDKHFKNHHIILGGHVHGGHVIFGKTKNGHNFPGNLYNKYCFDKAKIFNSTVIISKGLGDMIPRRFNCPREVVCVEVE